MAGCVSRTPPKLLCSPNEPGLGLKTHVTHPGRVSSQKRNVSGFMIGIFPTAVAVWSQLIALNTTQAVVPLRARIGVKDAPRRAKVSYRHVCGDRIMASSKRTRPLFAREEALDGLSGTQCNDVFTVQSIFSFYSMVYVGSVIDLNLKEK